jgi:hypothetical protein
MKIEKIMKNMDKLHLILKKEMEKIGSNYATQLIYNYLMKSVKDQEISEYHPIVIVFRDKYDFTKNKFHQYYLMSKLELSKKEREYLDNVR